MTYQIQQAAAWSSPVTVSEKANSLFAFLKCGPGENQVRSGNISGRWPSGGCSMSPFLSQVPIGWMSDESISLQKSLVLSLPSRRRRRRIPIMPITVAMQTELEFRGSRASSFMPALNSLDGGTLDCRGAGHMEDIRNAKYLHTDQKPSGKWTRDQYRSNGYLLEASRRRCNRRSLSQVVFPAERFYQQVQQKRNTEYWEEQPPLSLNVQLLIRQQTDLLIYSPTSHSPQVYVTCWSFIFFLLSRKKGYSSYLHAVIQD